MAVILLSDSDLGAKFTNVAGAHKQGNKNDPYLMFILIKSLLCDLFILIKSLPAEFR